MASPRIYRAEIIGTPTTGYTADDLLAEALLTVAATTVGMDHHGDAVTLPGSDLVSVRVTFLAADDSAAWSVIQQAARAMSTNGAAGVTNLRTGTGRHHRRII